jgi:hypothetical protein
LSYVGKHPECIHCAHVAQNVAGIFTHHEPGIVHCEFHPSHRETEAPIEVAQCLAFFAHYLKVGIEASRGRGFDIDDAARDEARRWMEEPHGLFAFACELFDVDAQRLLEQERRRWRRRAA